MTDTKCSEVNPCFNGGYFGATEKHSFIITLCLNPCSNGRY
ncbi:hypothetical protein HMPREF9148_02441, partial [Prevotella sp. F0091]